MRRYGSVIGVKPEGVAEYERLHADTWPEVLATIHAANMRNYSIFRFGNLLFAYFEYIGDDYAADMAKIGADQQRARRAAGGPGARGIRELVVDPGQRPIGGEARQRWQLAEAPRRVALELDHRQLRQAEERPNQPIRVVLPAGRPDQLKPS